MSSEAAAATQVKSGQASPLRVLLPIAVLAAGLVAWELVVRLGDIQPYVLPGPWLILQTLVNDWGVLSESLLVTLTTTLEGFICAAVGGIALALLFNLYHASPMQTLRYLKLPAALPYILGGLRIAGGLSLIGAVVAEIAAGSAGAGSGLAYRIAESGYRLNIPRMFAALLLLSIAGIAIYFALSLLSYLILRRWHESALG